MRRLSAAGSKAIEDIAKRHGFSIGATLHMLDAVIRGNGSMAQFDHREFSGSGQWMRGGMTMVSNMFDTDLKGWVDALCLDLANLVVREPQLFTGESAPPPSPLFARAARPARPVAAAQPTFARSGDWWPAGMGHPNGAGSQNGVRYAYFARARRLAIERAGTIKLYDTADHLIGGVSQQISAPAGSADALVFTSQHGPVRLSSLNEV